MPLVQNQRLFLFKLKINNKIWCARVEFFIYNYKSYSLSSFLTNIEETLRNRQKKILELFETSGPRLHRLMGRLTLSEEDNGDLLQELFLRLWNSKSFEKAKDPFAYAYRAAINLAFEWRRDRKESFQSLEGDYPAQVDSSALGKMIANEELEQVLDATMQLSDLARDVVVMHYIEQESYEEIAKRLGKKPQYLRALNAKSIARLRELLAGTKDLESNINSVT
jgi:RNA polymerase sigma factor (sigma-70 family)